MENVKEQYLIQIMQSFMKYGIKSVTMDDISKDLGISKKTLYKYFKDKDEIVYTLMKTDMEAEKTTLFDVVEKAENAIDETYGFSNVVIKKLKNMNPSLMYDLEKYYPKAWELFNEHKRVDIYQCIKDNIDRGIKENLYRKNINSEIIAKLYSEKIETLFDKELFPYEKFTFEEVYTEMIRYHLKGIVSKEGYKYLKESEQE